MRSFSGPYFPAFELNMKKYSIPLRIQSECGKIRIQKAPNTGTFRAVFIINLFFIYLLIYLIYSFIYFNFYFNLGVLSQPFTNHRAAEESGGLSFNSSLPLPPASQTFRHQPGDYCRELTSADRQQLHPNQTPLLYKGKSLTTKLGALDLIIRYLSDVYQKYIFQKFIRLYL